MNAEPMELPSPPSSSNTNDTAALMQGVQVQVIYTGNQLIPALRFRPVKMDTHVRQQTNMASVAPVTHVDVQGEHVLTPSPLLCCRSCSPQERPLPFYTLDPGVHKLQMQFLFWSVKKHIGSIEAETGTFLIAFQVLQHQSSLQNRILKAAVCPQSKFHMLT